MTITGDFVDEPFFFDCCPDKVYSEAGLRKAINCAKPGLPKTITILRDIKVTGSRILIDENKIIKIQSDPYDPKILSNGNANFSIFEVSGSSTELTLENIILDGESTGNRSGVLVKEQAQLTLGTGSVIKRFKATGDGGGIHAS
jgi:hypothetical protein